MFLFSGMLATSYCTKLWQLTLVQGVLTSIGMGLIFGSDVPILMTWFTKHIDLATRLASIGGSTGENKFSTSQI